MFLTHPSLQVGEVGESEHSDNSFYQSSLLPSNISYLGHESKSHGTSSSSLILQILHIYSPRQRPSLYSMGYSGERIERDNMPWSGNGFCSCWSEHCCCSYCHYYLVADNHFENLCIKLWAKPVLWKPQRSVQWGSFLLGVKPEIYS